MDNTFNDELEVQTFGYLEDDRGHIRDLALECGFKLKPQADGSMDLNEYVYAFADALRTELLSRAVSDMENGRHYCAVDEARPKVYLASAPNAPWTFDTAEILSR